MEWSKDVGLVVGSFVLLDVGGSGVLLRAEHCASARTITSSTTFATPLVDDRSSALSLSRLYERRPGPLRIGPRRTATDRLCQLLGDKRRPAADLVGSAPHHRAAITAGCRAKRF